MKSLPLVNRLAATALVLVLAAGCAGSTADSPQPAGSATPAPTASVASPSVPAPTQVATPSVVPSEAGSPVWPYKSTWEINDVLFGEDGRVVLVESHWSAGEARVTVLDRNGVVVRGWPWSPGQTGDAALGVALGPAGSLYVNARGKSGSPLVWSQTLHRVAADGTEMAGFPLDLQAAPFCSLAVNDGAAVVSCGDEEAGTGPAAPKVTVVEPDGTTRDGWPVALGVGAEIVGFGPDGRVYLQTWGASPAITALGRDGTLIVGWPQKVHTGDLVQIDRDSRLHVTSHSEITEECGLPDKTTYTILLADGRTAVGWPVSVKGWSSDPEIASDGTMVVASEAGVVTSYTTQGDVADGWPVRKVGVTVACSDGSQPYGAGDGAIVIVGEGHATLLGATGTTAVGWPVALPYKEAASCPTCVPGPSAPMAPAVGQRAVYVGAYVKAKPHIIVIERDGSMPKAAQVSIGETGHWLQWVRIAPTGRVWALTNSYLEDGELGALYLVAEDTAPGS